MKKVFILLILIISCFNLASCKRSNQFATINLIGYMNTDGYIRVEYNPGEISKETIQKDVKNKTIDILDMIEKTFASDISTTNGSLVQAINNYAGEEKPVELSKYFIDLFHSAIEINTITDGAFNPLIGPLVKEWNITYQMNNNTHDIPSEEAISSGLQLLKLDDIKVENNSIQLLKKGMSLDFGAIAKGYATDLISKELDNYNFPFYVINLGGNVLVKGDSKLYQDAKRPVEISIKNPFTVGDTVLNVVCKNQAISTSAVNERFIIVNEKIYSHIISPFNGYPVDNNLYSVTIIGEKSTYADALSTGLFILGLDKAIEKLLSMDNYNGVIITNDKKIYIIGNLSYTILNNEFEVIERK